MEMFEHAYRNYQHSAAGFDELVGSLATKKKG